MSGQLLLCRLYQISSPANCYKKTKFDFSPKIKILATTNLPKITQFEGGKSGTAEFPDLVVNICRTHPDKKIEKDLISSRPIGPNDGARLCLVKVFGRYLGSSFLDFELLFYE